MNIVMIGMRGAGKSNISRRLSVLTKRPVLSTDLLIEYEHGGKTISQIIEESHGDWRAFRDMEFQVVKKLARMDNLIIDCGGGIIVDLDAQGNEIYSRRKMELLKRNGRIYWLKGDIPRLAEKVKGDQTRPTLDQTRSAISLMERRLPFYQQAADVVLDIENHKRKKLAKAIFKRMP